MEQVEPAVPGTRPTSAEPEGADFGGSGSSGTGFSGADFGGDPVCWAPRVCPECGLFVPHEPPTVCPRCGAGVGIA